MYLSEARPLPAATTVSPVYPNFAASLANLPPEHSGAEAICPAAPTDRLRQWLPSIAKGDRTAAHYAARLIGSLRDPASVDAALRLLPRRVMDRVVAASATIDERIYTDASGVMRKGRVNTVVYQSLARAVALSASSSIKGAFVASSGALLKSVAKSAIEPATVRWVNGKIAAAMSDVIGAKDAHGRYNVGAVIENTLMQNTREGASDGRVALKAYAGALLDSGHGAQISAIIVNLQCGGSPGIDPLVYLDKPESRSGEKDKTYRRAAVLGNWVGIACWALQSRISGRDQKAAIGSLGFTGSVDTIKELLGASFPAFKMPISIAAGVVKPCVNEVILGWRTELAASDRELADSFFAAAMPHHKGGNEATASWTRDFKLGWLEGLGRHSN